MRAKPSWSWSQGACTERIYPVGRLDKNSLGLLLFTNDGDLTKQLTHPAFRKKKIYQVSLDKPLTRADMDRIAEGITLEDGEIFADEISYVKDNKQEVGIEIHSGRNRIVRRIFEFLGYTVTKLDRVYYAGSDEKEPQARCMAFPLPRGGRTAQVRPVRITKKGDSHTNHPFSFNACPGTSSSACSPRRICPTVR